METSAFKGLPLAGLLRQGMPMAAGQEPDAAGLLSGEQFLQMFLGLAPDSAPAPDTAPGEDAQDGQEDNSPDGSWLSLMPFIASAVGSAPDGGTQTSPAAIVDAAAAETVDPDSAPVPAPGTTAASEAAEESLLASQRQTSVHSSQAATEARSPVVTVTAGNVTDAADVAEAVSAVLEASDPARAAGGDRASAPTSLAGMQSLAAGTGVAAALAADRSPTAGAMAQPAFGQHVRAPLHSARWAEEMGQRVALMAVNGRTSGSLSLVPEQMGPIEVRIHMNQDRADVWFGATQADTRAALQEALPRLREMFSANGLALGEAQVSQQAPRRDGEAPAPARSVYAVDDESPAPGIAPTRSVSVGLVDTYA